MGAYALICATRAEQHPSVAGEKITDCSKAYKELPAAKKNGVQPMRLGASANDAAEKAPLILHTVHTCTPVNTSPVDDRENR